MLVIAGGGVFVALIAGVLVARAPALGAGLGLAALFAPIAITNLPLGIALWTTGIFISIIPGVGIAHSMGGMLLAVAWAGAMTGGRAAGVRAMFERLGGVGGATALLVLWLAISSAWSKDIALVQEDIFWWIANGLVLIIIVTTVDTEERLRLVAGAFVVGAMLAILIGTLTGDLTQVTTAVDETEARFGGGNDPNEFAAGLVPATALALGLAACLRPGPLRLASMVSVPFLVLGVILTQSRGGLVAGAFAVVAALVVARGRRIPLFGAVSVIVLVAAFGLASTPGALERVTDNDNGGNGRTELWSIAWRMAGDNPIIGVGLNQFRVESAPYVRDPGNLEYVNLIVESPHVVHNTYLQLAAETGVIGLGLFLAILSLCLLASWRAAALFHHKGRDDLAGLAQGILVAQAAILAAAFFLSTGDFKFWLLLGLGPAAYAVARQASTGPRSSRLAR